MPARLVVAAVVAALLSGCSPGPAPSPASSPAGSALRAGPLGGLTAHGVVQALTQAGLPVAHPLDTTQQYCPAAGCEQSVSTDQFRVESFLTTGRAQRYAADHGVPQVQTVVMEFAPTVPQAQRQRYWAEVVRDMD